MSVALLEAVATDKLKSGSHVIAIYNGIGVEGSSPEHVDSLSVIHLGEHLERLTAADLRTLDTQVPLETLRAPSSSLATEIGQEGREGKRGRHVVRRRRYRRSSSFRCRGPLNFNPFRGYSRNEPRHPRLEGARANQGSGPA